MSPPPQNRGNHFRCRCHVNERDASLPPGPLLRRLGIRVDESRRPGPKCGNANKGIFYFCPIKAVVDFTNLSTSSSR